MSIALISDVHGNLQALEAVLEDIAQKEIDKIVCLGDVATIGPQPNEVLTKIKDLGCPCIIGNHDAALLKMDSANEFQIAPPLISTLQWCENKIIKQEIEFLKSFQSALNISFDLNNELLCFHGSPASFTENIFPTTSDEELDRIFENNRENVLAGGHTHIQMIRQYKGKYIINPGSVGCVFENTPAFGAEPKLLSRAEYAVVNFNNGSLSVELFRIPFDIEKLKEVISKSDLPVKEWWLSQYE